jgi:hypothetical protein
MLENSWAVQGILVLVTHLSTVHEVLFWSDPVKPLAVLGYFQSCVNEEETIDGEDMTVLG